MKYATIIITIVLLSTPLQMLLPWWIVAICCFVVGFIARPGGWVAFLCGFLAIALQWSVYALLIDQRNEHLLSTQISELIFKSPNTALLITMTAIVGGLIGGLSTLCGHLLAAMRKD